MKQPKEAHDGVAYHDKSKWPEDDDEDEDGGGQSSQHLLIRVSIVYSPGVWLESLCYLQPKIL